MSRRNSGRLSALQRAAIVSCDLRSSPERTRPYPHEHLRESLKRMTSHCFASRQLCGDTEHLLAATAAACSNFAAIEFVDCPMYGECEVCISPKRQMRAFGLVRGGAKKNSQPPAAPSVSKDTSVTSWACTTATAARVVATWIDHVPEALHTPKKSPDGGHRGGWAPGLFQE